MKTCSFATFLVKAIVGLFILNGIPGFSQVNSQNPSIQATRPQANQAGENVTVKYKKEEYFDFDALTVKGQLVTPEDLTNRGSKKVKFNINKYIRKTYDDIIRDELMTIY